MPLYCIVMNIFLHFIRKNIIKLYAEKQSITLIRILCQFYVTMMRTNNTRKTTVRELVLPVLEIKKQNLEKCFLYF